MHGKTTSGGNGEWPGGETWKPAGIDKDFER